MDILNSPHIPPSLIGALTLYPFLFITLGRMQAVKNILPPKADTQKHYHLCNKIVASVHSTIMTCTGLYLLLTVDWSKNDISTYKTALTPFLVGLELGYLTQDTAFEFYQRAKFGVGSNLILFHHVSVILGSVYYLYALTIDNPGPYFIGMLSLMNMSTPILHFRWVLQSNGRTFVNSKLKRFIDTALMITYFWCRIFGNWWMGVAIGAKLGMTWYEAPFHIGKKFTITTTTMFFMNVVWWLILAKQWLRSVNSFYFTKQVAKKSE
ncbi:hypothetical protein BGZ88_000713 [Linnemannia elongata]|uniref:TLC domain-containing protein n=1 Tax=Linnemannia elongata AG-77 TaxID=1314771 RepID=A0A197KJ63_9FUNG|nr:hypothetical protein BGZ88_000713 [Linnemannia elongata]KAG0057940.1 hypothetical protein BGZ89_001726 [Linnemannia elongata]KAK5828816.1 TLC domain-containing protein [Linnemannia elongata]OAQ36621.1 hypothetical protein K457DRAFT_131818 [Linnemannia elongata AG-77]